MYHFVMTIQSIWNGEPKAIVTQTGVLDCSGKTRSEVYAHALWEAKEVWAMRNPRTSAGEFAVIHFSLEPETL